MSEVLAVTNKKVTVFLEVRPCCLSGRQSLLFYGEGSIGFLRNLGTFLPHNTALQPRRT